LFEDKKLTCKDCGEEFLFTVREQEFYQDKGFQNDPSRCASCRAAKKQRNQGSGRGGNLTQQRQLYKVVCDECGKEAEVPFEPSGSRPVYCRECFANNKQRNYNY